MSYKNYKYEILAHDYNSPYLRNNLWTNSFFKYPKLIGISRPIAGIISKNNEIDYLVDLAVWSRVHQELKSKILSDFSNLEDLIDKSACWGEKLNIWTEKNIFKKNLKRLSGKKLIILLKKFIDMQEDQYVYGSALPVLDFSNFSFIEGNLNRFLKEKVPVKEFQNFYSVFTEPENNSFAQDQEEDLLRLINNYWSNTGWLKDVKEKDLDTIKTKYPDFYLDLSKHSEKHAWVYYVYVGPAFKEKDFYEFIVGYVKKGIPSQNKLKAIEEKRKKNRILKEKYLKKLKPSGLDKFVLEIASKVVWAKPRRKDYQSKSYYHVEKLSREIARRLFISLEQVRSMPINILEAALTGKKGIDLSIAADIKNLHICLPNDNGTVTTLIGKEAERFIKKHIKKSKVQDDFSKTKELKGLVACPGKARGVVKIVNIPKDMIKMEAGDILVSVATTPSIVPAMKKAAAIVTDEGGLTCHASIVSRELNIPCIVGLKFVTQFVKDGDRVEVDASRAIIKKL